MNKILNISLIASILLTGCKSSRIQYEAPDEFVINQYADGPELAIHLHKGKNHNHPLMAIWAEDLQGTFIQTLYVAESIGKGVFEHGDNSKGKWMPGEIRRPAALPVWSHRRGIQASDGLFTPDAKDPVPDAYTGPTPPGNFILYLKFDQNPPDVFNLFMEINQSWDWNEYWHNDKYPGDEDYKTSCQPALVYKATVILNSGQKNIPLKVTGHSHFSGDNGEIYEDLSTITTALNIVDSVYVTVQ